MRRRLDRDLRDCTACPHHYMFEIKGELHLDVPPLALYDEALWTELETARQRVHEIEERVLAACIVEPLDAVEIEHGRKLNRMADDADPYDEIEWNRIEANLRDHAATVERKL